MIDNFPLQSRAISPSRVEKGEFQSIAGIDLFKFLMAIVVVSMHSTPIEGYRGLLSIPLGLLTKMAVPFFLVASGYLIFSRMPPNQSSEDFHRKLVVYIRSFAKLYVYWSLVYLPIAMIEYRTSSKVFSVCVADYLKKFFFSGMNYYSWQLWYLVSIVYGLIVVRLLARWRSVLVFVSMSLYVSSIFLAWIMERGMSVGTDMAWVQFLIDNSYNSMLPIAPMYLCIGMLIAKERIRLPLIVTVLSIVVFAANVPVVSQVAVLFPTTSLFLWCKELNLKQSAVWLKLRKASSIIYFTHMLFLYVIAIKMLGLSDGSRKLFVVVICLSLLFSFLVISFENRFKWLKILGR